MTATLEPALSPYDRLDPVAAAVRWWTSRLTEVLQPGEPAIIAIADVERSGGPRLPPHVTLKLPPEEVFLSRVVLPPGAPAAHRKALMLRLAELAPLDPVELEIAARRVGDLGADGRSEAVYAVAMARAMRLATLEESARRAGARSVRFAGDGEAWVTLDTARARRAQTRARLLDIGLALALVATGAAAAGVSTRAIERETEALLLAEQSLRRAAVAEERVVRDAELAEGLLARGLLERRAEVVLQDLAALNAATPDGAWWTRLRWTPGEVTIAGASREAAAAIESLSAAASGWRVAPAGPVRAGAGDGLQTFELKLTWREVGDGG
jgi:hypothetical protein